MVFNTKTLSDLEFYWTLKLLHIMLCADTEATALQSHSPVRNGIVMQRFLVQQSSRMLTLLLTMATHFRYGLHCIKSKCPAVQ
jgi:hypothetical protein